MPLPSNNPGESLKKLSRARFLRDSVITASGIVLLPSMLTSCKKYVFYPDGAGPKGWGGVPNLTDLKNAADNLTRMRDWSKDNYQFYTDYEDVAFGLLSSTRENDNWANFIGNIFIDIGAGIIGAVGVLNGPSLAIPALACVSAFLKDWGLGKGTPPDLAGTFAEFREGNFKTQLYIEQKLASLADPGQQNNYANLLAHWQDEIEFNGKTYTLKDLADSYFPGLGDEYNKLQSDAIDYFKKSLWNLIVIKTCSYYLGFESITVSIDADNTIFDFARDYYKKYPGLYLRGRWDRPTHYSASFFYWYLGLGGNILSDAAAQELFMDDTPGHIINPEGLFSRSYFFEQFSKKKNEDFAYYGDEISATDATDFDYANTDFNFTAGLFPSLIEL